MEPVPAQAARRLPDYHVHTRFSDGHDEPSAYAARAVRIGLPELGFSDHLRPSCLKEEGSYGMERSGLDDYVAAVRETAAAFPELRVLLGIETDYLPEAADEMAAALAAYPFDYVLCSVHFVDGFGFIERRNRTAAGWRDVDHVWRRYYETLIEAVRTGAFDVVAHLDLPKKWGYRPAADMTALEDDALRAIAAAGVAIEINTSGYDRHPAREMYPAAGLLERARRAGIEIVVSSDAHRVADLTSSFAEATALARRAGYDSSLRLSARQLVALP